MWFRSGGVREREKRIVSQLEFLVGERLELRGTSIQRVPLKKPHTFRTLDVSSKLGVIELEEWKIGIVKFENGAWVISLGEHTNILKLDKTMLLGWTGTESTAITALEDGMVLCYAPSGPWHPTFGVHCYPDVSVRITQ